MFRSLNLQKLETYVASNGKLYHEIVQGAENTVIFEGFIDHPLYQNTPLVLMDNITFHKNIRYNRGWNSCTRHLIQLNSISSKTRLVN